MNKIVISLLAFLLTVVVAEPSYKLNPQQWLPVSELEAMPSLGDVTLEQFEKMPAEKGAKLIRKFYHLSQINHDLIPSYVPSASNIPVTIWTEEGNKVDTNLNGLVEAVKQLPKFGEDEVTIFVTGLPEVTESISKAKNSLIQAYKWRYSGRTNMYYDKKSHTSSEEDYSESWKNQKYVRGNLIVIDLGSAITNIKRFAMLDIEETGALVAKVLVDFTNEINMPQEIMHIVAQGIASHVAGAAARQYTRLTGHKLRRITALDPSIIMARYPERLTGLARGDAEFVDAIHTSANGMGTRQRVADVDFFPNGLSVSMPGTTNVIEASMRATRYFAESVRPGNERNFPAVAATSLDEYKQKHGYGKRTFMGIDTDFDVEGDYMLEVNPMSPFGISAPAEKQNTYHGSHFAWMKN